MKEYKVTDKIQQQLGTLNNLAKNLQSGIEDVLGQGKLTSEDMVQANSIVLRMGQSIETLTNMLEIIL